MDLGILMVSESMNERCMGNKEQMKSGCRRRKLKLWQSVLLIGKRSSLKKLATIGYKVGQVRRHS